MNDDGDFTEKDFTGTTGETADHSHSVKLDDDGNGKTGAANGHGHDVTEFEVMEANGHTHELTKDGLDEKADVVVEPKTIEETIADYLSLHPADADEIIEQVKTIQREQEASEMLELLGL